MTSPDAPRARRHRALLLCAALAVLLCGAGCASFWQGLAPQGPPPDTESARRLRPGPWKVAREDFRLVDATRPTPARGDAPEAPERRLETTVWLPREAPGPRPLVIYSHGFLSDRLEASYLAEHLASHGYLVAAADFPLSSRRVADDPTVLDVVNQPGDVGFLIDWLLGRAPGPPRRPLRRRPTRSGSPPWASRSAASPRRSSASIPCSATAGWAPWSRSRGRCPSSPTGSSRRPVSPSS